MTKARVKKLVVSKKSDVSRGHYDVTFQLHLAHHTQVLFFWEEYMTSTADYVPKRKFERDRRTKLTSIQLPVWL